MQILAIDPGTTQSAWIRLDDEVGVVSFAIEPNQDVLERFRNPPARITHLAMEMVASYGMPVGAEVFETVLWAGRIIEAVSLPFAKIYRKDVKLSLCGVANAKDGNVRQAIIDRYGGKVAAIGNKKTPGPLYGVKADVWQALAVAITFREKLAAGNLG